MLERLFDRPDVLRRLRAQPSGELLEAYATYLQARGHARSTMRGYVWAIGHFNSWLHRRRRPLQAANAELVQAFLRDHLPACRCPSPAPKRLTTVRQALNHLLCLLRGQGRSDARPVVTPTPMDTALEQFRLHLRDTCGLAESTCRSRIRYAREFLRGRFGRGRLRWEALRPGDVVAFVADYAGRCRTGSAQVAASSLRSFLRYLQFRGWCGPSLVAAVPRLPHWRLSDLPKTLTDEQLDAFLTTFDRTTSTGRRDYAMALCQVVLGLRVGEVAGLCLEDLDWRRATVRIVSRKAGRARDLPLPARVGEAIGRYLRDGRPETHCRNVFVRHRVPKGAPVSAALIAGVVRLAFAEVEGCAHRRGTHVLRHTAATMAEYVPLDASHAEGFVLNQGYFNSGTWRRVHRATQFAPAEHEFIAAESMTYLAFFQGDERGGRPYETWTGTLGINPVEAPQLRIDPPHTQGGAMSGAIPAPHFSPATMPTGIVPTRRA